MTCLVRSAPALVLLLLASGCSGGNGSDTDAGLDADGTADVVTEADALTEPDIPPLDAEWPVGIPYPSFGVDETVESVHGDAGYCTHHVDNTGTCDDSGPGTPGTPRCTIPYDLVAGDVVCIAAGTYEHSGVWMDVTGTADAPIFIRGPDGGPRPVITHDGSDGLRFDFTASYLVIENLEFAETRVLVESSDHVVIRNNHIHSSPDRTCLVVQGTEHVILGNEIDHCQDNNRLGVAGSCGTSFVWVIGNHIHHNAEDSIQFGHGCESDPPNHLYFGFNVMHSDRENAVDLKWVHDVIVSQNEMYGYRPAPTDEEFCYDDGSGCYPAGFHDSGSDGSAMVIGSDGTSRDVWVLLNTIHDSQNAVRNEESTLTVFFGNVVHSIAGSGVVCE
ncbi:MAG: right-handed parallel beta-helix repeat-containing protein, partial [Deltaproteobacteria bacterium]|nr:right-handed parallel beta-helix repeat-containing protein [Deltaproteobacteria bacterium]